MFDSSKRKRERTLIATVGTKVQAGTSAAAYNNLGVVHLEARDFKRAASCFEKAITANPTFYEKANDNLRRAQAALAGNYVIGHAGKEACL